MKRALVISGGGSKGAYGGGIAQYLINDLEHDYELLLGTSTGALLTSLLALEDLPRLKDAYTSVNQKDIFKISPFRINNKGKVKINFWNVIRSLIKDKRSFGDSSNLRKLLDTYFTADDYIKILQSKKEIVSCVSNMTKGIEEYKSNLDVGMTYEDYKDWMYASTCVPPFMSVVTKNNSDYVDGGLMDHIPIQEAINRGATDIDIIILRPELSTYNIERIRNAFHLILKMIDLFLHEISTDDVNIGTLMAKHNDVKLHFYYTDRKLINNSLVFDKKTMLEWWNEGYLHAKQIKRRAIVLKCKK